MAPRAIPFVLFVDRPNAMTFGIVTRPPDSRPTP